MPLIVKYIEAKKAQSPNERYQTGLIKLKDHMLNTGRCQHSSCVAERSIYLCCGVDAQGKTLGSLERLNVREEEDLVTGAVWETLNVYAPRQAEVILYGAQQLE